VNELAKITSVKTSLSNETKPENEEKPARYSTLSDEHEGTDTPSKEGFSIESGNKVHFCDITVDFIQIMKLKSSPIYKRVGMLVVPFRVPNLRFSTS
jgi:hypothetical protein